MKRCMIALMLLAGSVAAQTGGPNAKENALPTKPPAPTDVAPNSSGYRIGEQDLLNITVWKEPELSGPVVVRPDGKITLPLVNDIQASGLTPAELRDLLSEKLRPFVTVPEVTVAVREINSRKVFVIGQIAHEGSYRINSSTTVLQIIAEAGGLNEFANRKRIYVLRKENGAQVRLSFNYDKVVKGKDASQDVLLRPGDTIVVP
ncbi:MAG TPA: polysaccharide biosynthesis/export family protein [Candidatus Angelobacter sp.]|jgi:polysaccharide export outer membrane protein|nr:polysaccharide biosynthesis/export family protein [Candidatus Angelobacter sp.]